MIGYGTVHLRIDHELVGRVIAEKHRIRFEQRGLGDDVRPAKVGRRGR